MRKTIFLTLLAAWLSVSGASSAMVSAQTERGARTTAQMRKIGLTKARRIALRKAPGKIESGEFEVENGKSVYSFDIRNRKGTITEVQVQAFTGEIISVEEENRAAEAAEKKADAAKKSKAKRKS